MFLFESLKFRNRHLQKLFENRGKETAFWLFAWNRGFMEKRVRGPAFFENAAVA